MPVGRAVDFLAGKSIQERNPTSSLPVVPHRLAAQHSSHDINAPRVERVYGGRCSKLTACRQPRHHGPPQESDNARLRSNEDLPFGSRVEKSLPVWRPRTYSLSVFCLGNNSPQMRAVVIHLPRAGLLQILWWIQESDS